MSIRDVLAQELPRAALAILAAKRGGPMGLTAFMQGNQEAQARQQQLQRQAMLDEQDRAESAQRLAMDQAREKRLVDADKRDEREAEYQRRIELITQLGQRADALAQTAPDAETGERQLASEAASLAQIGGVEPDLLMSRVPSMGPKISLRKAEAARRWAKEWLDEVERKRKSLAERGLEIDDATISLQWADMPEPVQAYAIADGVKPGTALKPDDVARLGRLPASTFRTKPKPPSVPAPNTAEEQFYATFADERGTTWSQLPSKLKAEARRQWSTAGRQQDAGGGGTPYFVPLQTGQGVVSFNSRTGQIEGRIADLKPGETAQRELANGQTILGLMDRLLVGLTPDKIGPLAGRFNTVEAAITGGDPTFATLAAQTSQLQNVIINLRTGAAMSEPEAARIMAEIPSVNLPPATYIARLKNAQQYYRDWQKNRSTLAFGRTTEQGVTDMITPPPSAPPPVGATYDDYLRSRGGQR